MQITFILILSLSFLNFWNSPMSIFENIFHFFNKFNLILIQVIFFFNIRKINEIDMIDI